MLGNHSETLTFHLIHGPQQPIILGYPWLRRYNPHIYWASGAILQWSAHCHAVCLRSTLSSAPSLPVTSEYPDLSRVPLLLRADSSPYLLLRLKAGTHRPNRWTSEAFGETRTRSGTNKIKAVGCWFESGRCVGALRLWRNTLMTPWLQE